MKKIIIDGVIGWEYTATKHRENLDAAAGDDLDIQISSTGGSVYDGNTIKQLNEKYKRDYPGAKVIITTYGMAMSAASVIALSGDSHEVHEDSVYMIHNPWGIEIGDYRVMRKTADDLEKLSSMYARVYSEKSGKSTKENRKFMDDESYFYGQEIIDAGFADKLIKKEKKTDKSESLAFAKLAVDDTLQKMKAEKFDFAGDLAKAVALIPTFESKIPASAGITNNGGHKMNLDELKRDHPDLYAQAVKIGKDDEFENVQAHITMGRQAGSLDLAAKNIEARKAFTASVSAEYMAAGMKNQALGARLKDDANTGNAGGNAGGNTDEADTKAYQAQLEKKVRIKK
ncbi:MAG: Clp protease ClpP [Candidatus Omnitrophica bacterium]|nr:Clp protease ClpP [Candidatus Omnitrophota bacterium]